MTPDPVRPLADFTRSVAQRFSPFARKFLVEPCFTAKVILMRYRARVASIASSKISQERSRVHRRTLALIVTIVCVPVLGTVLAVVFTTEPDLSDLMPSNKQIGEYFLLSWPKLLQTHHDLNSAAPELDGTAVQALGYMVDGAKAVHAGDLVQDFVLLPDAGNLLDPADRFGDQMVSVHLRDGDRIQFSPRRLVWVLGTFRATRGDPSGSIPLYYLERARTQPADRADIGRYFIQ
jgi:hypothetical protein